MLIEDERGEIRVHDGEFTSVMTKSTVNDSEQHIFITPIVPWDSLASNTIGSSLSATD